MRFLISRVGVGEGRFLKFYDPDWKPSEAVRLALGAPEHQTGRAVWTDDPQEAMHFVSLEAAIACWQQTSTTHPVRPDGRPNRPLSAHTVEVIPVGAVKGI
jgi:hypothetical protein